MIVKAWGTWDLFQALLLILREIGNRHGGLSIANIATRWVLDHRFVGAVIIGNSILLPPTRLPLTLQIRSAIGGIRSR